MSGSEVGEAVFTSGASSLPCVTSVWIRSRSGASRNALVDGPADPVPGSVDVFHRFVILATSPSVRKTLYLSPYQRQSLSILYDDLPAHTKDQFKKKVILLSLETTGALKPWFIPKDNIIIDIWNLVFGAEHHIEDKDIHCKCFLVVKTLIKHAISTWLHKFAETAVKALAAEFAQQGLDTQAGRSSFVIFLLGNIEDLSDKKRPFLWESVYDNLSAWQEGIFQGRLVGRTFLEHLQIINNIDPNERVQEPPVGALILAVQAVHRALLYLIMGPFQLPSDKRSAKFSKMNRGDYSLVTPCGERVFKRATVFLKAIKNLKKEQWTDIFKVAMSFQVTNKHPNKLAKEDEEELSETDSDEYDDLVDPHYNEKPVELDHIAQ
ncbi:hypothetical protein DFH94DRAFT_817630 [Russula ochroleuca]|uniref:Uncharacterized protein n=1 Tax=Russula ochroleuca TaxID=152965 RepID=A0A9P5MNY2_9AGAM|nr:hypothetical protein DFH94DRAFT_817630 [Russula ochroleuca]